MEKYKSLLLLIPFMLLMVIILDFDQGESVSYTETFLVFTNVVVMGSLTYFIYITNKRLADLSERQIQNDLEFKVNPILHMLEDDINSLYDYSRFLKHNFDGLRKKELLLGEFKGIVRSFEDNRIFTDGTYNQIKRINASTKEGSQEINEYFNKIVVVEYFNYQDLSNVMNYVKLLEDINGNLEYRKIALKFSRDLSYGIALTHNLKSMISRHDSYDFVLEQRIGSLSSFIHDIVFSTITDLENVRDQLLEQVKGGKVS